MLAVPAQVAGVKRIVVCTPPSKYGRSDLVLAACHELGLTDVFRAGGAAAIAAMAFGTETIPAVDKIVGPGNTYVQLAKRALAGVRRHRRLPRPQRDPRPRRRTGRRRLHRRRPDRPGRARPGQLLPADDVARRWRRASCGEIERADRAARPRRRRSRRRCASDSAIIVDPSMDELIDLANRFAAEHVNVQTSDDEAVLAKLVHAGAVFLGPYSPVAAGDYVAGPSHCLPTNTTARFSSGISVYEFLKRSSVVRVRRRRPRGRRRRDRRARQRRAARRPRGERAQSRTKLTDRADRECSDARHVRRARHSSLIILPSSLRCYNPAPWLRHSSVPTCARWHGYTPGEQPGAGERVVKLNTNENPFPPSPKVMQAIQQSRAGDAPPLPEPDRRRVPRRRRARCSASRPT